MAGGGGKGGTQSQEIDPGLTAAARDALDFSAAAAALPYSPNRGVQIAGFTPQQEAAFANSDAAAGALGLATGGRPTMPALETSANGIKGYSTGANFDEIKNKSMSPELQEAMAKLFANPETGEFNGPSGPLYSGRYASMPGVSSGGK
jgi:hypothetical protein